MNMPEIVAFLRQKEGRCNHIGCGECPGYGYAADLIEELEQERIEHGREAMAHVETQRKLQAVNQRYAQALGVIKEMQFEIAQFRARLRE